MWNCERNYGIIKVGVFFVVRCFDFRYLNSAPGHQHTVSIQLMNDVGLYIMYQLYQLYLYQQRIAQQF